MADLFCGIDFGTSNSTVSLADRDRAWLVALEAAEVTLPSAVFWDSEGAPPEFGRAAVAAYLRGEDGRLMRGLKSTLGSGLIDEKTAIGGRAVSFRTVLARYFGHLRAAVPGVARVVLGRPVHFVDDDAAADGRAQSVLETIAREVGFAEVAFQYEPIAAALQYEQGVAAEELVLIVDIGGGTSDFSIVRVSPQRSKAVDRAGDILANDGIRVGGTDFDRLLSLAEVMPYLGYLSPTGGGKALMPRHYYLDLATWAKIPFLYTQETRVSVAVMVKLAVKPRLMRRLAKVLQTELGHDLAFAVEAGKIAANGGAATAIDMGRIEAGLAVPISAASVDRALLRFREALGGAASEVCSMAGITAADVGSVVLVGGSSLMRVVADEMVARFPAARMRTSEVSLTTSTTSGC